ncbi:TetR/AcrR family transcriptional regulator [Nocardiopsis metallicus]|uniref:AcrR family transcriptional regulator n=1 Tax=Nocardiopsis metallicus TaxID=179819 RepID=A0A840WC65_9ACTN|nr:helix-turn-helix domain-containing protein [Nocardiopsis metallicus]MBB5493752.1 AcrR family transcriptional regulator [Nocardiopsis metallicus]
MSGAALLMVVVLVTTGMSTTTRDKLLDAAARLLDSGGPEAVTPREAGRSAGVSHNTPYKHFADKEDLLAEIAAGGLDALGRRCGRCPRPNRRP